MLWRKSKEDKISDLWNYFKNNYKRIFKVDSETQTDIFAEFVKRLKEINENIVFEVGLNRENETIQLTISADGIKSEFEDVIAIVNGADNFENVKVNAFRQPIKNTNDLKIKLDDAELLFNDFEFTYSKSDLIDINVYVKNVKVMTPQIQSIIFLVLDSAIGEFNVATKIGKIGMYLENQYPLKQNEGKLFEMKELRKLIG